VALTVAALSLGPSFAHALESWPRLAIWSPDLWREATVFNAQYALFQYVGGPLDVAAVVLSAILAYLFRADQPKFGLAVTATVLFVWAVWVAPVNAILATWPQAATPGPVPENFDDIRTRWESGHIVIAALKLLGFMALSLAVVMRGVIFGAAVPPSIKLQ
jgi:hypothetical protein